MWIGFYSALYIFFRFRLILKWAFLFCNTVIMTNWTICANRPFHFPASCFFWTPACVIIHTVCHFIYHITDRCTIVVITISVVYPFIWRMRNLRYLQILNSPVKLSCNCRFFFPIPRWLPYFFKGGCFFFDVIITHSLYFFKRLWNQIQYIGFINDYGMLNFKCGAGW